MIRIQNLNVKLPSFDLRSINLSVEEGEFFILIGPTGAGKTLLLETIMGLIPAAGGHIFVQGRDVTRLAPEKRGIGIVYQDQALFPHLNVLKNITYGLRYASQRPAKKRLDALVGRLALDKLLNRSVAHLSGGEKQRVALARALVVNPTVLLLDEPLSALDPNFRDDARDLLNKLHADTGLTVLMVTHDFAETHMLAGRIALINQGKIEQFGTPADVFFRPATPFAADFVGMSNLFPAVFKNQSARLDKLQIALDRPAKGDKQFVAIRPEDIRIDSPDSPIDDQAPNRFEAIVSKISHKGIYCDMVATAAGLDFKILMPAAQVYDRRLTSGSRIAIHLPPGKIHLL